MWLMFTTVFGFMVLMLFGMMIMMHFLKKTMIAEDSTTIDEKPETHYTLDS
ncbi:hypothetical protein [Bhargavaea beijingensis]|uniref:Uncharacterized protein n=1 Tax=Bhargavaea beijingensis TaxID=426756 RepID=A0A1G7BCX5_9BACL|nr:hypothetical protein [Bhargavaea beijingensis]MCW1928422.1 hypothetical protein [Bhargavaea beijingensis]SDE24196.1 hypothetical protein SAMN04488126_105132 [Bhargavaea beijingensis]